MTLNKTFIRWDKLILLWILFSFQLLLIGIFVIFGSSNVTDDNGLNDDTNSLAYRANTDGLQPGRMIKFIENVYISTQMNLSTMSSLSTSSLSIISLPPIPTFQDGFFKCTNDIQLNDTQYCFRNGSVETFLESLNDDGECICKCQLHYHGKDCGQPEVVWRAFISSRISRPGFTASHTNMIDKTHQPFRVFYMIHTTALSLATVEIQMMEVNDLVDLFILCDETQSNLVDNNVNSVKYRQFRYHQLSSEHRSDFILKILKKKILILETTNSCTPKWMYKTFRTKMNQTVSGNDILLFSNTDEIINRQAILYMKWYNDWTQNQPIKFRLKHNVYGFYWQHPNQTTVRSGAAQLHVLDEQFNYDPGKMFQQKPESGMIIGDLNHGGGWFCQYCYESTLQIVNKLQIDHTMDIFKNNETVNGKHGPSVIDGQYIETLISAGIYFDGKINLLRNHRFSDKYYAPDSVVDKTWKYESILSNMYAHYDDE